MQSGAGGAGAQSVEGYVLGFVGNMHAHALHEVFLALPFGYALRLLHMVASFVSPARAAPAAPESSMEKQSAAELDNPLLSETIVRAALLLVHVHHRELSLDTHNHTGLLLALQALLREKIAREKKNLGFNCAAMGFALNDFAAQKKGLSFFGLENSGKVSAGAGAGATESVSRRALDSSERDMQEVERQKKEASIDRVKPSRKRRKVAK